MQRKQKIKNKKQKLLKKLQKIKSVPRFVKQSSMLLFDSISIVTILFIGQYKVAVQKTNLEPALLAGRERSRWQRYPEHPIGF